MSISQDPYSIQAYQGRHKVSGCHAWEQGRAHQMTVCSRHTGLQLARCEAAHSEPTTAHQRLAQRTQGSRVPSDNLDTLQKIYYSLRKPQSKEGLRSPAGTSVTGGAPEYSASPVHCAIAHAASFRRDISVHVSTTWPMHAASPMLLGDL